MQLERKIQIRGYSDKQIAFKTASPGGSCDDRPVSGLSGDISMAEDPTPDNTLLKGAYTHASECDS